MVLAEDRRLRSRATVRRRAAELLRTNARAVSHGIMHGHACAKYAAQAFSPGAHLILAMLHPIRCALRRLVVLWLLRKRLPSTLASVGGYDSPCSPAMQAAAGSATAFTPLLNPFCNSPGERRDFSRAGVEWAHWEMPARLVHNSVGERLDSRELDVKVENARPS